MPCAVFGRIEKYCQNRRHDFHKCHVPFTKILPEARAMKSLKEHEITPYHHARPESVHRKCRMIAGQNSHLGICVAESVYVEIGRACVGKECRSRWSPYH